VIRTALSAALVAMAATACGIGSSTAEVVVPPGTPQADTAGNDAPIVRIEQAAQTIGAAPGAAVTFTGSVDDPDHAGADAPVLRWDFGDGATAEGPTPAPHTYATPGRYLVTLSAKDSSGASATPSVRVVDVGTPAAPSGNSALRLTGAGRDDVDRVKIPVDDPSGVRTQFGANIGATDTTIELWLRAEPGSNAQPAVECGDNYNWVYGNIVLDRDRYESGKSYGLSIAGGVLVYGVTGQPGGGDSVTLCGKTPVTDGAWHHVAMTRTAATGDLALYVDGRQEAARGGPAGDISYPRGAKPKPNCYEGVPCTLSDPYLVIGAEKHDVGPGSPAFTGLMDELRLSRTIRYTQPFSPPRAPFTPDADTAALYHFDEGGGPVVLDSATGAGAPTDGIVRSGGGEIGPFWAPSNAVTGS